MSNKEKIDLNAVRSVIANATKYDDDPEEVAILLATSTVVLAGLIDMDLETIIEFMTAAYPAAVRASAVLEGYPITTQ